MTGIRQIKPSIIKWPRPFGTHAVAPEARDLAHPDLFRTTGWCWTFTLSVNLGSPGLLGHLGRLSPSTQHMGCGFTEKYYPVAMCHHLIRSGWRPYLIQITEVRKSLIAGLLAGSSHSWASAGHNPSRRPHPVRRGTGPRQRPFDLSPHPSRCRAWFLDSYLRFWERARYDAMLSLPKIPDLYLAPKKRVSRNRMKFEFESDGTLTLRAGTQTLSGPAGSIWGHQQHQHHRRERGKMCFPRRASLGASLQM